jgi:hypothetical protein
VSWSLPAAAAGRARSPKIRQETHRCNDADVGSDAAACPEELAVVEAAGARESDGLGAGDSESEQGICR